MTKITTLLLLLTIVAIGSTTTAYAFILADEFDEPCPMGQSIIQEVCVAANDLHDILHIAELDIDILQTDVNILQDDIINATNRITNLENEVRITFIIVEDTTSWNVGDTRVEVNCVCPTGFQITSEGRVFDSSPKLSEMAGVGFGTTNTQEESGTGGILKKTTSYGIFYSSAGMPQSGNMTLIAVCADYP